MKLNLDEYLLVVDLLDFVALLPLLDVFKVLVTLFKLADLLLLRQKL
jgi:hypothetical protein